MFELFATPLGILMSWIYNLVPNYFIALVLFTVLVRLVLFPLSIKNQKNQVDRARLAPRLERLQKKYGQDRQKMMQKQQELYEKEGVKMTGGCLPMLLQMLVLFSVIAVIYKPLTYIQQIPEQDISDCISVVDPTGEDQNYKGYYRELNLFKAIEKDPSIEADMEQKIADRLTLAIKDAAVEEMMSSDEVTKELEEAKAKAGENFNETEWMESKKTELRKEYKVAEADVNAAKNYAADKLETIKKVGSEFSIFGISLLEQPSKDGIRPNWLWLIAIASGLSAFFSGKLSM